MGEIKIIEVDTHEKNSIVLIVFIERLVLTWIWRDYLDFTSYTFFKIVCHITLTNSILFILSFYHSETTF